MEKIEFNDKWKCYRKGKEEDAFEVILPHDAMLLDGKSEHSAGGVNTGWYDANDYMYEKHFFAPEEYQMKSVFFEFEGIYHRATVYINEKKAAYHHFGYTGFFIDTSEYLKYGAENVVRVEVINSDQPNSRWYTGTGIYRPVWITDLRLSV